MFKLRIFSVHAIKQYCGQKGVKFTTFSKNLAISQLHCIAVSLSIFNFRLWMDSISLGCKFLDSCLNITHKKCIVMPLLSAFCFVIFRPLSVRDFKIIVSSLEAVDLLKQWKGWMIHTFSAIILYHHHHLPSLIIFM